MSDHQRYPYGIINGRIEFSPEYEKTPLEICWGALEDIFKDNHAVGRLAYQQVHCDNDQLCWQITVNYIIRDLTKESIKEFLDKVMGIIPPKSYSFQISDASGKRLILSNISVK